MCHLTVCWTEFTPHRRGQNISGDNAAFSWWICPWGFLPYGKKKSVSSPGGTAIPWVHPGAMLEGTLVCPEVWAALRSGQSPRSWLNQNLLYPSRPHSSLGQIVHPEAGTLGNSFLGRLSCKDNTAPKIKLHHFQVHLVIELLVLMSFLPKLQGNAQNS